MWGRICKATWTDVDKDMHSHMCMFMSRRNIRGIVDVAQILTDVDVAQEYPVDCVRDHSATVLFSLLLCAS